MGTIERSDFKINPAKTRMQLRTDRQMVTGLVANKKVNVRSEYYRFARSMCHSLFTTGEYRLPQATEDEDASSPSLNVLEGILGHIYYVREGVWRRKLDGEKIASEKKVKEKSEPRENSSAEELYRKFLFYRRFVCPETPVIIGDGKTDNAYLRAAMRKLSPAFSSLVDNDSGLRKVHLFNYSRVSTEVLRLGGGTDPLKNFICNYAMNMGICKAANPTNPVIVVIDNDKGASGIFGYMHNHKPKPSLTSTDQFYHIGYNLYLVKTPENRPYVLRHSRQ